MAPFSHFSELHNRDTQHKEITSIILMNTQDFRKILERHAPPDFIENEAEACDYLCAVLVEEETLNIDTAADLLAQFLPDASEEILLEWRELKSREEPTKAPLTTTTTSTATKPMSLLLGTDTSLHDCDHTIASVESATTTSDESSAAQSPKQQSSRRAKREERKRQRRQKKNNKEQQQEFVDDDVTAWQERQSQGKAWGGRGHGGRGVRGDVNTVNNIHLANVTLQFAGNELLHSSTIQINGGHRYGLLGRNGCGKSVLLKQLAAKAIPGMPQDMKVLLVQQQVDGGPETAVEALLNADEDRVCLLREQEELEEKIERGVESSGLDQVVERLGEVASELDAIGADKAERKARDILRGLQFSQEMMNTSTDKLSGGWRMRVALARALFIPSDLLLLDEPSNHLDLYGLMWLSNYLETSDHTLIVVSHDRNFLDICTDIISFEHKKLHYHVGNYSEYCRQQEEKAARHAQILDASERQRVKATAFIQKQEAAANKKHSDPKKQRQAKMIKEKKLERIGYYREDGKRYKNRSLAKLSEDHLRTAQKVHVEADEPAVRFKFPDPTYAPGMNALVRFEDVRFSYTVEESPLLDGLVLDLERSSKVAVVGRNAAGKSTLLKLITGEIGSDEDVYIEGNVWRHRNLRTGYVSQHSVEDLEEFADKTVVDYAEDCIRPGKTCREVAKSAGGNIRQYLGRFGIGGALAHRQIGSLSGGERMRVCFAQVMSEEPQLLVMDEVTNHLDIETLDSLSRALNDYKGAIVIVSHNQGFLSGFCKELWVVEGGKVDVRHSDTDSFDQMFSQYRNEALTSMDTRSHQRQARATLAKRAQKQRSNAKHSTGLIP